MKGGTPRIRRTVAGVVIRVASGTHAPKVLRALNDLLTALGEHGHVGMLRDVASGKVTPLELLDATRGVNVAAMPRRSLVPLSRAVAAFLARMEASEAHRRDLRLCLDRLAAGAPRRATAEDMPALLRAERERCQREGKAQAFNHARNYVRAFLRATLGSRSEPYAAVADMEPLRASLKRAPHPCTMPEVFSIAAALPPLCRDAWLAMCLTGAMPDELWGGKVGREGRHWRIAGTKREARNRLVPCVEPRLEAEVPSYTPKLFRARLKDAGGERVTPYDGRRTFAALCERAGVPPAHRAAYLGHARGSGGMTQMYGRGNEAAHLDTDAALLAAQVRREAGRAFPGARKMLRGAR